MSKRMKIYEIGTGYTPISAQISAATEIVVEELTKAFMKQDVPVEILDIACENRAENALPIREVPVPKCFSGTDVKLGILHKLKRVVYSVALARTLKKLLKQTPERVVLHFHNQYNLFFFLKLTPEKLRRRCLIAYTNHSGVWRMSWQEIEKTVQKRYFQEAACMKQADLVFLLNEETRANVVTHLGVPEERIVVIDNGVNTDLYRPLNREQREQARTAFGLEGCRVILQVGSVNENKGQLRSARNLTPLLKERPELVFAYAGGIVDQMYQEKIQAYAAEQKLEKQIRYLGMIEPGETLNKLYNCAEMTVVASNFESFSLVTIESCAAGVPVLVNEGSLVNFGAGCVSYSEDTFTAAADRTEKELEMLGRAARTNALEHYSWDVIAGRYAHHFLAYVEGMKEINA